MGISVPEPAPGRISRGLLSGIFILAGCLHFLVPKPYMAVMPPYIPMHRFLVLLSGLFEILGGIGVLVPFARRFAGWGLIALLIAVFPANIYMAQVSLQQHGMEGRTLVLLVRLPLQFLLIWWVCRATQGAAKVYRPEPTS